MAKVNLLPRKEFEIVLDDGQIVNGKYGIWAVKRFCDKKGLSLQQMIESLGGKQSLDDVVETILCAVEYSCRKVGKGFTYTDIDVCEWIEAMGGFAGEEFRRLTDHAGSEDVEVQKKSQVDLVGEKSSDISMQQEEQKMNSGTAHLRKSF